MSENLFGDPLAAVKRFGQKYPTPRKKLATWTHAAEVAPPVMRRLGVPLTEEQIARIQRQRAEDHYHWAVEKLAEWRGRLPESEWQKLKAIVDGLKP